MTTTDYFLPSAKILPIEIESAKGCYLYDTNGKQYLDGLAGMGVNALGHQHPKIMDAIEKQSKRNLHLFGYFMQDVHRDLAKLLLDASSMDRIFYTNSGTEAIEAALKLAKKWGNKHHKKDIICFTGGFHGRSLGALSVTAQIKKQEAFQPLLPNIVTIDQDVDQLEEVISEQTAALVFELIYGEGGIVPFKEDVLKKIVGLQEKFGFKLIIDEIQSGIGRTGELFRYMQYNFLKPDIVASAKMIGGALPLGAILMTEEMGGVFSPGEHGSTFGGNPLSCATGLVVLKELLEEGLLEKVKEKGEYFRKKLYSLRERYPEKLFDIRIFGLMIGIDVPEGKAGSIMENCLRNGLIVNATQNKTIRFLPPLIISESEIDEAIEKFEQSL